MAAAVRTDLDTGHGGGGGPRTARQQPRPVHGNGGAQLQLEGALEGLPGERGAALHRVPRPEQPVHVGVPRRVQRLAADLDVTDPLDGRDPHPVRDHQADGAPVVGRQRTPVHLVGEQHVVQRLRHRQRTPHPAQVHPVRHHLVVQPARQDVDRAPGHARQPQDVRQPRPAPVPDTDRAQGPGRAGDRLALLRGVEVPAVARALDEQRPLDRPQGAQPLVRELHRAAREPVAPHLQPPRTGVDARGGGVVADEEPVDRGEPARAPQRGEVRLRVRPPDGEKLGRQRLDDARSGLRRRPRPRGRGGSGRTAPCHAQGSGRGPHREQFQQVAAVHPG